MSARGRMLQARGAAFERLEQRAPDQAATLRRIWRRQPKLPLEPSFRRYGMGHGTAVDRVYIERFLEANASDVRGDVLEVLDDTYTQRFGGDAVAEAHILDLDPTNTRATVRANLETGDGVPTDAYDCFICTQVISITYEHRAVLATAARALKPGGVLLLTVPGISHQAEPDGERYPDHWRFTWRAIDRLLHEAFGDSAEIDVYAEGTVAACAAFLYGMPAEVLPRAALDPHDPDYEMVICGRAVKPGGPPAAMPRSRS